MDLNEVIELHSEICNLHDRLSEKICAMSGDETAYRRMNLVADKLLEAADLAYGTAVIVYGLSG